MKRKFIIFFVIIVAVLFLFPNKSKAMTVNELRNKFPSGKYWNHIASSGHSITGANQDLGGCNNPDGYTSVHCYRHDGVSASAGQADCNCFDGGQECLGFALKLYYDYYGLSARTYNNNNGGYSSNINQLKPGDILEYVGPGVSSGTHSVWVIEVNGDDIKVAECNWLEYGYGGNCNIHWDRIIKKSTVTYCKIWKAPKAIDDNNSRVAIDTVTEGKLYKARLKNNSMTIDGWAMTDASGAFVQIYVDNDLAVATHNVERYDRPDVSSNKNVGYRAHYDYSVLKDGEHTLSVRLYSAEHNILVEKKVKFKVLHVDLSVDTIKNGNVFYKYEDTSKNTFDVNGYAITKYKNSFVQFYLDNNSDCYVATHLIPRGSYDGITGYTNPGYYRTINYSNLSLGEHTLKIRLYEKDVNQILEEIDIKFTIKEAPKYKLGDVDENGEITVSDAIMVLQHVAKNKILTGNQLLAADVDKTSGNVTSSESITVSDAIKILQYVAKNISSFD